MASKGWQRYWQMLEVDNATLSTSRVKFARVHVGLISETHSNLVTDSGINYGESNTKSYTFYASSAGDIDTTRIAIYLEMSNNDQVCEAAQSSHQEGGAIMGEMSP